MKTKIAVYTSTRAEFGLLSPLMARLKNHAAFELRLFVTGTHFSADFGSTVHEIEKDFKNEIYYRVAHGTKEDQKIGTLGLMADALEKYAHALAADRPDLAVVLGDRYEAFCFGIACASLQIKIVHLHGGELSFGALDDKFRHGLTKLSEWHMVACETYRRRVIQLGEYPENVFNVGALGVDNALNQKLLSAADLEIRLQRKIPDELYLLTFHPETSSPDFGKGLLEDFLERFSARLRERNALVVVTGVNSDAGSGLIRQMLLDFTQEMGPQAQFVESLGVVAYLSLVKRAVAVVGNSSSGILEAASLQTPTLNLGHRQDGRERESSVYDFPDQKSLSRLDFDRLLRQKEELIRQPHRSLFGDGSASQAIIEKLVLIASTLSEETGPKGFYDLT